MSVLPTGTVTFLFTDVEGSTRLLEEFGDRYAETLAEHRRVLREAFARHGGVEVDTQGDAFFFAFAKASDALAAAAEGRDALGGGPIRVRMGLHTGEPVVTDEGYVGIDVHRAARIAAAGHGGQILVSQPTRDLAANGLRDLGEHRLKDLAAPERIYQLGDGDFPPLKSLNNSNLPLPAEPLVGRKKELADVLHLLRKGTRLVTITGPGGIGKTRFACELAGRVIEDFPDGVWWVGLARLRDPALVLPTIGGDLRIPGKLDEALRTRHSLLLLDNFEQVAAAAVDIAALQRVCANLFFLVTSREPLHIAGEHEYPLPPLAEAPAVELLRQRAEAVDPTFAHDYRELVKLCDRLDRLPLAIELAAGRTKAMSIDKLLQRLDERLPVLTSRRRDVEDRQRTLRATIEWSFDLLSAEEQQSFIRLGIFAGGFDADAAREVCEVNTEDLESLVDKNLLTCVEDRFRMLEVMHEYATEKLAAASGRRHIQFAHARYFLELAKRDLTEAEWTALIRKEHENILVALDALRDLGEHELELELAVVVSSFWHRAAYVGQGRARLEAALAAASGSSRELRVLALRKAASLAHDAGDWAAMERHARARLELRRAAGEPEWGPLVSLGIVAEERGRVEEAEALFTAALADARRVDEENGVAIALTNLGNLALARGELDAAEERFREGLSLTRSLNVSEGVVIGHNNLGLIALARGNLEAAGRAYGEVFATAESVGFEPGVVWAAVGVAAVSVPNDIGFAVRLLGAAETALSDAGLTLGHMERRVQMDVMERAARELPPQVFEAEFSEGQRLGAAALLRDRLRDIH